MIDDRRCFPFILVIKFPRIINQQAKDEPRKLGAHRVVIYTQSSIVGEVGRDDRLSFETLVIPNQYS